MKHPAQSRPALLFSALLIATVLAACNQAPSAGEDAAATTPAGSEGPSAEALAAAASAAAAEGAEIPADAAAAEPTAPADATADAEAAAPDAPALQPGVDYDVIKGGQPYEPLNGKIEVVEVFGYICPACARFEPAFTAWKARQPADVRVTYVPAPFNPQWVPYAQSYYVAESMGLVDRTHTALFHAIHIERSLPDERSQPDDAKVAGFYGQHGADPKRFLADMRSFSTEAKVKRATQFIVRNGVGGTPTLVINGKYRARGRTYEDMLRITEQLVTMERAEMQESAAP